MESHGMLTGQKCTNPEWLNSVQSARLKSCEMNSTKFLYILFTRITSYLEQSIDYFEDLSTFMLFNKEFISQDFRHFMIFKLHVSHSVLITGDI